MKAHITMMVVLILAFCFGSTAFAAERPNTSHQLIATMKNTNATKQLENAGMELSYKLGKTSTTFRHTVSGSIGICKTIMSKDGAAARFTFLDTGCDERLDRYIVESTKTSGRKAREKISSGSRISQLYKGLLLNVLYVARVSAMSFPTDPGKLKLPERSSPQVVTRRMSETNAVEVHGNGGIYFVYEVGPYKGGFEYDEIELANGRKLCSSSFSEPNEKTIYFYDDDCDGKLDYWTYHNAPQTPTQETQAAYERAFGRIDYFAHIASDIMPKQ